MASTQQMKAMGFEYIGEADQYDRGALGGRGFYLPGVGLCHARRSYHGNQLAVLPATEYGSDGRPWCGHKLYALPNVIDEEAFEAHITALCERNPHM